MYAVPETEKAYVTATKRGYHIVARTGLAIVIIYLAVLTVSHSFALEKIHSWVQGHSEYGKQIEFLVIMGESADLSPVARLKGKEEKGRFVHGTLREAAEKSQSSLKGWLKAHGVEHRSFYLVNALLVKGDRALIESLAVRDDVARIEGNPEIRNHLPRPEIAPSFASSASGIEWNIIQIGAPDMWTLGITGDGIVIGGQDTGYRWTHNALKNKYRGWNGAAVSHDYNWHDAVHSGGGICGPDAQAPCDDYGHGTHTMGTALGDDGVANQIGVAPGAKWIGCRNMDQGTGTPSTYLECFEFLLAPYPVGSTPAQGDPSKAPDLTVNSWGCPASEGCSALTLETAVNNMKAAGIMTIVSAGNNGSTCGSVDDPPAIYRAAYSVGATASDHSLAGFSSRGPSDTTGLVKPDIVAPGVSVRSAYYSSDSSYTTMSGTSMAVPEVAGSVALIWSAKPSYRHDQDGTEFLLNGSATKLPNLTEGCGGDYVTGPNNSWGYGFLNIVTTYNMQYAVRTDLPSPGNYSSLASAYSASASGATIKAWGLTFDENLTCGQLKNVTLKGGYDQNYTINGGYSTLHGSLSITNGSVTVERLIVR